MDENKLEHGEKIVVYGTESSGIYMTEVLKRMNFEIWGYSDSSKEKQGKVFLEKRIFDPQELWIHKGEFKHILIASSAQDAIAQTLDKIGFSEGKEYYKLPI